MGFLSQHARRRVEARDAVKDFAEVFGRAKERPAVTTDFPILAASHNHCSLTDELRGRPEAPDGSAGRTISSRARGDTTERHGPLQRLLDARGYITDCRPT
jgi:hypothetical protein